MKNETTADIWERAETFCYHSDVENLTVKHIDLVADFAKQELSDSTSQIAALRSALESIRGLPNGKSHTRAIGIAIKALAGQGIDRI